MATSFGALCTDFYINQKLALKMDLPTNRETVLDLFDRVRKTRPNMDRFRRYDGELALESVTQDGAYDWMALRRTSVRSGSVNPDSLGNAYALHRLILEVTPFYLSISPLDIDYLELTYGFDLEAEANHDEIVFDALYADTPLGDLVDPDLAIPLDVQPFLTFALDEEQRLQVNVEVKTRSGETEGGEEKFSDDPISVYLSLRQMGPVQQVQDLLTQFDTLAGHAERIAADKVVPLLINPITKAINSRSR